MLNSEWYVFELSYLLDIHYSIKKCELLLEIEARVSLEHPLAENIEYEIIVMKFSNVQYYKSIMNTFLLRNPNEDLGDIWSIQVEHTTSSSEFTQSCHEGMNWNELDFGNNQKVSYPTSSNPLHILKFLSENISFEIAFEKIETTITQPLT